MKECKYCRSKYDDNLAACPNCGGTKVVTAQELAEEAAYVQRETEYREKANVAREVRKKRLIGTLAAIVVVIIAVIAVISINANKPLSNGMTKEEGNAVFAEGIAFYDAGDYESAIKRFDQLPADSKQYAEAQELLEKSIESYRTGIMEKVNSYIQDGEYDVAVELIKKAHTILSNDTELQTAFNNAYRQGILNKVSTYEDSGKLDEALALLENAQTVIPNDVELQNAHASIFARYKAEICMAAIEEADAYAAEGNYESAIKAINFALNKIGHSEELSAKLSVYSDVYSAAVIKAAKDQYVEYNADAIYASISFLEQGLNVLPENISLQNEYSRYLELQPISVTELIDTSIWKCEYPWGILQDISDTTGQVYKNTLYATRMSGSSLFPYEQYVLIDLDFQYTRITGSFYANPKYQSADAESELRISVKSAQEYLSTPTYIINGESSSIINFEIDLTGAKEVFIRLSGDCAESGDPYHYAYIGDLLFWK